MKLRPEELEKNGYVLVDKLKQNDLILFLNEKNKEHKSFFLITYFICLFVPAVFLSFFFTKEIMSDKILTGKALLYCIFGGFSVLLFIPFHELLHGLAYKMVGAKNISYFANFKKFYFATISDKSVLNVKEFKIVALFPFLFVVIMAIFLSVQLNSYGVLWLLSFVMVHNVFCWGDFSLLNYMEVNKKKNIVTFDDREKKETYFYIKN